MGVEGPAPEGSSCAQSQKRVEARSAGKGRGRALPGAGAAR